jgi:2,3-bisphosphoglycerate-independent phosphoglycerate mutase
MKILFVILDGCADVGVHTPYQLARKPHMDALAAKGVCGLLDIGYKTTPESDFGYLNLLGFYSDETYTGRGYLEALGLGMEDIRESDICIRGNFATIGSNGNVLDRRAGRDESGLEELAARLDGMEIDGVHFFVRKTAGHRAVVVLRALDGKTKLSDRLVSNDPEEEGVPVRQIKPRVTEAKFTASVLNKFIFKSNKILSGEDINKERKLPANILLLRGFGRKKESRNFGGKYGMKACCVAGIPIVKGVASLLGMDIITVHGATGYPDTNLKEKFEHAVEALKKYAFVLLHINGTDILSHDGKPKEKTKFIEKIDQHLGDALKGIDMKKTVVVITSDHRTASDPQYKFQRHTKDPVPVLISGGGIRPGRIKHFDEQACAKGFSIKGNDLIPFVLSQLE